MFLSNHWIEVSGKIESFIKKNGIENFMQFNGIKGNMIQSIDAIYEADMKYLLKFYTEYQIDIILGNFWELEKYNPIHHLYCIEQYKQRQNKFLTDIKSIIEWGGGYGSMARIVKRINPDIKYTIIDLPVMTKIQKYYLKGTDVKCISIDELDKKRLKADMLLSTWALTESTEDAWNYVKSKKFFGAKQFLFGYLLTWPTSKLLEAEFKQWDGVYISHMESMKYFNGYNPDDQNRFLFI